MRRSGAVLLAVLGVAAGTAAAQASVTGRWHVRLYTGATDLRGDLRLLQDGTALSGSLVVEWSDAAPVPIEEGAIDGAGELTFSVNAGEKMRFSGRRSGTGLAGQVALSRGRVWSWIAQLVDDRTEFYAARPRFRSPQLVIGRNLTELRLPGAWVSAAEAGPSLAAQAAELAIAAGLPPIPSDSIAAYAFLPALGVSKRAQMVAVMVSALSAIRADLPAASRPRFDAFFHPRDRWVVDLHDAALNDARLRVRNASWLGAEPALAAAGLIPQGLPPGTAVVPLALYRLAVLRERDSLAFQAAADRLPLGGPGSAQMADALLNGYRDAASWQGQALEFLLTAEWVREGGARTSPAAMVRAAWARPDLALPRIRPHYFGYPEAVPRVAVPDAVVGRLVVPENWSAGQWALRHGPAGVLNVLRQLDLGVGSHTTLETDGPSLLTSVAREAAATPAGFLEPADEILEDPGNAPLFAVATAIHEWQHILMEEYRFGLREGGTLRGEPPSLSLQASDLYLAEGFAEWMAARVLAPILVRTPIVGVGDARKLAVLETASGLDPHVLGLRMLRALDAATGSPETTRALVLAHGDEPAALAAAVPAWRGSTAPDRVFPARGQRRLVPETQFTIEDRVGDVVGSWIRVAR